MGSRGSVIPLFLGFKEAGITEFPITDDRMTRFWITLEQSAELVITALRESEGGEIFVPKIPSMKITDLAKAISPDCSLKYTGIRPGEKVHESLVSYDEARNTKDFDGVYVILPQSFGTTTKCEKYADCPSVPEGFVYSSDVNDVWLGQDKLGKIVEEMEIE